MRRLARSLLLLSVTTAPLVSQDTTYKPAYRMPNGREVVAVYIGGETCGACHYPEVKAAVRRMKTLVADQAKKSGAAFSTIGVANDWDTAVAARFIEDVGPFDQLILGGNWTNLAIEHFIWRDPTAPAALPVIVVFERTVNPSGRTITFGEPRILRRLSGGKEIPDWVAAGAPISPATP